MISRLIFSRIVFRSRRISCSQKRSTTHPAFCNAIVTSLARCWFRSILRTQYSRLFSGTPLLHIGQPCQKQPSMKMATFSLSKTTSGFPGRSWAFFRQPFNRIPASIAHKERSGDVPLLLMAFMALRRFSGDKLSGIIWRQRNAHLFYKGRNYIAGNPFDDVNANSISKSGESLYAPNVGREKKSIGCTL